MELDDMKLYSSVIGFLVLIALCTKTVSSFVNDKSWNLFSGGSKVKGRAAMSDARDDNSLPCCPPGSMNCIRTSWTVTKGKDKAAIAKAMLEILQSYPQEGQAGVDKGGWKVVDGDLLKTGTASLEYQSGIGPFAFLFNFGKPFIDDLQIKIVAPNRVDIRSSSRIGKSDLGVNKKRLTFLGQKAKDLGWDVPEPNY
jgi:Protein of unknown function (DUF1499)